MAKFLANGLGQTTGSAIATLTDVYLTCDVWYVSSVTGTDAASPAGKQANKPLATLSQAVTNAAAGDIICLLSGHSETYTSALTINKRLVIAGAGSGTSRPTFRRNSAAGGLFTITAAGVWFSDIIVAEDAQSNTATGITCNQTDFRFEDCQVNLNGYATTTHFLTLASGADRASLAGTNFTSTATSTALQPYGAVVVNAAVSDLNLDGIVVDGGSSGWGAQYALDATAAATTRCSGVRVSLLRDSDFGFNASTTFLPMLSVGTSSGSARVTQ